MIDWLIDWLTDWLRHNSTINSAHISQNLKVITTPSTKHPSLFSFVFLSPELTALSRIAYPIQYFLQSLTIITAKKMLITLDHTCIITILGTIFLSSIQFPDPCIYKVPAVAKIISSFNLSWTQGHKISG